MRNVVTGTMTRSVCYCRRLSGTSVGATGVRSRRRGPHGGGGGDLRPFHLLLLQMLQKVRISLCLCKKKINNQPTYQPTIHHHNPSPYCLFCCYEGADIKNNNNFILHVILMFYWYFALHVRHDFQAWAEGDRLRQADDIWTITWVLSHVWTLMIIIIILALKSSNWYFFTISLRHELPPTRTLYETLPQRHIFQLKLTTVLLNIQCRELTTSSEL